MLRTRYSREWRENNALRCKQVGGKCRYDDDIGRKCISEGQLWMMKATLDKLLIIKHISHSSNQAVCVLFCNKLFSSYAGHAPVRQAIHSRINKRKIDAICISFSVYISILFQSNIIFGAYLFYFNGVLDMYFLTFDVMRRPQRVAGSFRTSTFAIISKWDQISKTLLLKNSPDIRLTDYPGWDLRQFHRCW